MRVRLGALTDGESFERMLLWRSRRAQMEASGELSSIISRATPRLGARLKAKLTYAVAEGALALSEAVLESEEPFPAATRIDVWMLPVVAQFDGRQTVAEIYEAARRREMLPEAFSLDDFTALAVNMIERGYLEID